MSEPSKPTDIEKAFKALQAAAARLKPIWIDEVAPSLPPHVEAVHRAIRQSQKGWRP